MSGTVGLKISVSILTVSKTVLCQKFIGLLYLSLRVVLTQDKLQTGIPLKTLYLRQTPSEIKPAGWPGGPDWTLNFFPLSCTDFGTHASSTQSSQRSPTLTLFLPNVA